MPTHEGTYPPLRYKMKNPRANHERRFWPPTIISYLVASWILLIYYQESYIFRAAIRGCNFQHWASPALPTDYKIALLGDPQLVDENTYSRRGLALAATKFYTDLYMRRNYKLVHKYLDPNTTIFTGDLFDGGREWEDDKWMKEFARFQQTFPASRAKNLLTTIPGNHDIGISEGIRYEVFARFEKHFGKTSIALDAGEWEIVVLDTVALSSSDSRISSHARSFMTDLKKSKRDDKPRILVTHVPLYRPIDSPCGPLRETNSSIKIQRGHQYQNVLDAALSEEIWSMVKPSVIFAGDDHDYCDYRRENGIHEINVKSFSWAMGIQRPGFQLVSLSGTRYETQLCILPGQLPLFLCYAMFLLISFSILLTVRYRNRLHNEKGTLPLSNKDDANKKTGMRLNMLQIWRAAWQNMFRVALPVLLYYVYMIWL